MIGQIGRAAEDHLRRMAASLQAWQRGLGRAAAGGRVLEIDGLVGSVVPAARSRSLLNAAVLPHGVRLDRASLAELEQAYRDAGGEVWGVWTHEGNDSARSLLQTAGYRLDSRPAAMAIELESLPERSAPPEVEVEPTLDLRLLAEPLGAGYGFPPELLTRGLPALLEHCQAWIGRVAGAPAAGLLIVEHEQDAGVFMVATAPELRRRGAAGYALRIALLDARERGCLTSTLQASAMGRPVYAALGYRTFGAFELWERRS